MDNELKNLRLNINQLAAVTDLHRQTISSKLNNIEPAPGSNSRLKLYSVVDILRELLGRTTAPELVDIDKMLPPDRKAWFQSERERLKFQQETGELIPASTVIRYDRNAHSLTITLADGGTYKIVGKGTLDGPVEITDTLTVQGKTWINADTSVAGNIGASKEITDKSGSMSKIREVFNNHDHRGDSGGLTDKPNQKM